MSSKKELPVVVIGSGPGGMSAAVALAEAGIEVIVLERGSKYEPSGSLTNQFNFESQPLPWELGASEWKGDVGLQRSIGLGGTSLYFQGLMQMPPVKTLKKWGLNIKEIDIAKKHVLNFLQVAGEVQPPHPLNPLSKNLYASAKRLGWKVKKAPTAILSLPHDGRPPCNYCGQCVFGCRPRDKSSVDNTWLPRGMRSGSMRVVTDAKVENINLKSASSVGSVDFRSKTGRQSIPVSGAVLAAGSLETPYILKSSRQTLAPDGLGNKHVGRNLRASLLYSSIVSASSGRLGHAGIPIDILIDEFESLGILLCQGRNLAGITGPASLAKYYASRYGPVGLRAWMREHYQRVSVLAGFTEISPKYEYGLVESSEKRFKLGASEADFARVGKLKGFIEKWARESKVAHLTIPGERSAEISGAMLRGTCQLGEGESHFAVSPQGLLYGYDNLVISDASILGTGLIAHPSLPLQVLGYVLGQKFAERMRS